ncbi:bone morphogenetic protein 3-like [Uloborus diversus]|uniref:bone morphogenetic protein 3-like n=1 Tax=Uloborus diversus TaxID=327109 RepID=UPI002409B592|nr:bone morphogenetic protein 3-like [Uloborus diversus]
MWNVLFMLSAVASSASESVWPVESRVLQLRNASPRPQSPPSYMLHLYNRYRKGRMPYSAANTVRSFFPTPGRLGNDDILVFNLTGVHPTEYVERVDLHLQSKHPVRQKQRLDQKKLTMEVDILDLTRPLRPKIETIPLSRMHTGGWQTLDLTDSIIACLEGEAEQHHLVGVAIRSRDNTDTGDVISQPFLVLFSEDDDHLNIGELDRKVDTAGQRLKREVLDNELPDYPSEGVDGSLVEVQARMKYKSLDSSMIPRPEARKVSKSEMNKHKKRRRRRRRKDRRLPYAWGKGWWRSNSMKAGQDEQGDAEEDEEDAIEDDPFICQKRKMVVNFSEIGWGDWIISPKTFDASYCSGVCEHPLRKSLHPSNHAVFQNLVISLGLQKDVPGLCCVPQSLSPVSLLFYDDNRNIVLKSYPNMSVENCSCR